MTEKDLAKLIRESRPLLKEATAEQRYRLLRLIRESLNTIKQKQANVLAESTSDYLDEI